MHGVLKRFRETVLPRGPELKKGVIHGDINEQNLLMHPEKPEVRDGVSDGFCPGVYDCPLEGAPRVPIGPRPGS